MAAISALAVSLVLAYLIGSFPTSYIFARILKGIDIRDVGSGNAGATNVLRSVGKIPALITLVIDILKGFVVVTIITDLFYGYDIDLDYTFYRGLMGFMAIAGHIWPAFLKFKGGKGVATTLGVGLGIAPMVLLPSIALWIAVFVFTHYVSLASILALIAFPIIAALSHYSVYTIFFSVVICSLSIYKHTENIKRLLKGVENKTKIVK